MVIRRMMKSKIEDLRKRGYIDDLDLTIYLDDSYEELKAQLRSDIVFERTIAAKVISKYKTEDTLIDLLEALKVEKKLYSKLAICESLELFGQSACPKLVDLLGQIGKNQHSKLPDKPFVKKGYPLPRDIVARLLGEIGVVALPELHKILLSNNHDKILEAVDAVGFISFYNDNNESLNMILDLFTKYEEDDLMIWKLLRCLQAFSGESVEIILNKYLKSEVIQHKWEAERSLEQLKGRSNNEL